MKRRWKIYTIGHSNRSFEDFIRLNKGFDIGMIYDARSFPTGRIVSYFSKSAVAGHH